MASQPEQPVTQARPTENEVAGTQAPAEDVTENDVQDLEAVIINSPIIQRLND